MIDKSTLPAHWRVVKTSEVGNLLRGINYTKDQARNTPAEGYLPVLRGNNISGELNFDGLVFVRTENIKSDQLIVAGDIIFAMSSGSKHLVGKSAKAKTNYQGSFGAFCSAFRSNPNVNNEYVAYFFQSPYYKKVISEISKGTNINNLKREHILNLDLPYPPLSEQQEIVGKIEELLSELDKGKEQLETARQQLKVYRQAVLKWAFEGKFTNSEVKDGELLEGWQWTQLSKVSDKIFDGPFGSNLKSKDYIEEGVRVIRLENIGSLEFRNEFKTYVSEEKYDTISKHTVCAGDIIFSSFIMDKIRVVVLPKFIERAINKADCFCVRVNREIANEYYVAYYLSTKQVYNKLVNQVHGATRPRINTTQLKSCAIPLPTLEEQNQIVQEIESRLSVCDKVEETINKSLLQAETLRQSILKQAFEGNLIKDEVTKVEEQVNQLQDKTIQEYQFQIKF